MTKILLTGGGTGGHVFPLIAIAQEIRKKQIVVSFAYMGPEDFTCSTFMPKEGIRLNYISSGKIRRYFSAGAFFSNVADVIFKIPFGILQAFWIMFFTAPDVIISKGGYGSIPAVIAGWMLRIPIFLHESDSIPGLANKISSKFCEKVFVSFPMADTEYFPKHKMIETGNPIRSELIEGTKDYARKAFDLVNDKPIVLILGGSQGSERINDIMIDVLSDALKEFEIIHQTGKDGFRRVHNEASATIPPELLKYYHPYFFLDNRELAGAYAAADCIVARSGAGTIFEIAAVKKPSILIPLPEAAQNHQVKNAYAYANSGASLVIEEGNLTHHFFLEQIRLIFQDDTAEKMIRAAELFSKPYAGSVIARYILDYLS